MSTSSSGRIDIRLSIPTKVLITNAAKAAGFKSVSEFVVQAALEKVDALATRSRIIELPVEAQEQLLRLLSAEHPNPKTLQLLKSKSKFQIHDQNTKGENWKTAR